MYPGFSDPGLNNGQGKVNSGRIEYVPVSTASDEYAGMILSDKRKAYHFESFGRSTLSPGNIQATNPANQGVPFAKGSND